MLGKEKLIRAVRSNVKLLLQSKLSKREGLYIPATFLTGSKIK